jgi:hypothetical protein
VRASFGRWWKHLLAGWQLRRDGAIIPIDSLLYPIFAGLGLKMRNRIIWHFEHEFLWRN